MPYNVYRAHDITFNYLPMLTLAATSHPRPFLFTICTWSYLLVQTSTTCPSHVPAATSHPPSVLFTIWIWSYLLVQTSSTWPSHVPATSHPPSVLATMHLELPGCTNFIIPGNLTPRQPPATLRLSCSLYAPGATCLYKLHLPGHPMPLQPPAGCLNWGMWRR